MSKPTRLFEIIQLLRVAKNPMTAKQIGDALEVSKRTAYRDIAALQSMRIPIDGEAGIGYIMRPGFDLPPLAFDAEEVEAIIVGLALLGRTGDEGLLRAANRAADKIATALSGDAKTGFDQDALHVSSWNIVPQSSTDTGLLRQAIREEEKLEISYQKTDQEMTIRTILPLAITYHVDVIVLAAWCELRSDYRHFRIDRMKHCQPNGDFFHQTGHQLRAKWKLLQTMQGD